ncbi:MAG: PKD domain-containing protein, partial [Actinomycetota bacterium]|nr:PKD domain-containing protein [Actinomycetota bacterium]
MAFHSFAALTANDTNTTVDVYVRDLQQNKTTLVSVSSSGQPGNGISEHPQLTPDGRYVAFRSAANNLVSGDTNNVPDIFIRDLQTQTTSRISISTNGVQANDTSERQIAISSDGRYVAFESYASNLHPWDQNGDWDVFLRDRTQGSTTIVSVGLSGFSGNLGSYYPVMSQDGRYVAFQAWASNLVSGDTNSKPDVFLRDLATATTVRVSTTGSGIEGNDLSDAPSMSPDGRYVAFRSYSTNLVTGDTNAQPDAFLKDTLNGTLSRVSVASGGNQGNGATYHSAISNSGPIVAFESSASNFVSTKDTNGVQDVFTRDVASSQTQGITTMTNAAPTASVTVTPASGDRSTSFTASVSASDPDGDPMSSYDVSWGDGSHTSSQNSSHKYSTAGDFNVKATVCDQFSLCSSQSSPVAVHVNFSNSAPTARLSVSPNQGDLTTSFTANLSASSDPENDPLTYAIDWGDGSPANNTKSASHSYNQPGHYTVEGRVTDTYGAVGVAYQDVTVCAATSVSATCSDSPLTPLVNSKQTCTKTGNKYYGKPDAPDHCRGTEVDEYFYLYSGDDSAFGKGLGDQMFGAEGQDVLHGQGGNDVLWGESGSDMLLGGPGDDELHFGNNQDLGWGSDGMDYLFGGALDDHLFGGNGQDHLEDNGPGCGDSECTDHDGACGNANSDTVNVYDGDESDSIYDPGFADNVTKDPGDLHVDADCGGSSGDSLI